MTEREMDVTLVGGPLDGERIEVPTDQVHGPDAGAYMVVNGPQAHPHDPGMRAAYEPEEGETAPRWTWRGWVP